jgi:protein phosphatase
LIAEALLERPDLSETDLGYLPKNVITRALGISPTVDVDLCSERAVPNDVFLLCSDGLHGLVSDDDIATIVNKHSILTDACAELVQRANEAGGRDNITVVLVRIEPDEAPWSRPSMIPQRDSGVGNPPE